jgi:dynein intermediate chain 2, axonemal
MAEFYQYTRARR